MSAPEDKFVQNGDVRLHFVEAGPKLGPLVLLLHGFPSFWYTWKYQIGPLADAGFHVVAPDLRGYNLSSKPQGIGSYGRWPVLSDITALMDACGGRNTKAVLVGHDWGGMVAWCYAAEFPERVLKLAVINMPHPKVLGHALWSSPRQMFKSSYMFLFHLPVLAEIAMSANNYALLKQIVGDDPRQPQTKEHVQLHVESFSEPGALTAAINYYRALLPFWSITGQGSDVKVFCPVLALHGDQDWAFEARLAEPPKDLVPNCQLVRLPQATHWVMWDEPEEVNRLLISFAREKTDF